ncbi:hypothetical protein CDD83_8778 [Cordyceps sp. RAO-2017]|nr:hypothetical protein CDD83_8778 [Cordyceps sp. RAO-2017]
MAASRYLEHCETSNERLVSLLSKDFEGRGRYKGTKNPVATTWLISFRRISQNSLAAQYLAFMCLLAEKDMPAFLLRPADELEADEAIGILKAYAFISEREQSRLFNVHRLVGLAMRNWLDSEKQLEESVTTMIQRLATVRPSFVNTRMWRIYLPHAQAALA